ncbi:MAG: hypothetical protein ABI606_17085 [Rhodoferax sp.]
MRLIKEKQNLLKYGVPIKLMLKKCNSLRFRIALPGRKFAEIETAYPTIDDPDTKGSQYHWEPKSPLKDYWLFNFYAWEWSGWRLINKKSGRTIETINECGNAPIALGHGLVATLCVGNYENDQPTLYVADAHKDDVKWSGGLVPGNCGNTRRFYLDRIYIKSSSKLTVSGYCASQFPNRASLGRTVVNQTFSISGNGISTKVGSTVQTVEWNDTRH